MYKPPVMAAELHAAYPPVTFREALAYSQGDVDHHLTKDGKERYWGSYGSDIYDYNATFAGLFPWLREVAHPNARDIVDLIADEEAPVVMDLMASSAALRDILSRSKKAGQLGLALTLAGMPGHEPQPGDEELGIRQLFGDIRWPSTFRRLGRAAAGRPANLILEHALGGTLCLPPHPAYFEYALSQLWTHLARRKGVILAQLPPGKILNDLGIPIDAWLEHLNTSSVPARVVWHRSQLPILGIVKRVDSPLKFPRFTLPGNELAAPQKLLAAA